MQRAVAKKLGDDAQLQQRATTTTTLIAALAPAVGDVQSAAECFAFVGLIAAVGGALSTIVWVLQGLPSVF